MGSSYWYAFNVDQPICPVSFGLYIYYQSETLNPTLALIM